MTDERDAADALGDAIDEIHRLEAELVPLRALADDLAALAVRVDSICSLVAAREPKLLDENRVELRAIALNCRDAAARYRQAKGDDR